MIDKHHLQELLLQRIKPLAAHLYPEGTKIGGSWRVGSLDINLKTGWWGDWDGSTPTMSRNLINLWVHARQVDFLTAVREIKGWLELPVAISEPERIHCEEREGPCFPLIEIPTRSELSQLSELRSISTEALKIAVARGFLWSCNHEGKRAWLLTDQTRKLAIARRLDGEKWESNDDKAKTIFGSWGNWPLGIEEAKDYPAIALIEGGPDFLSEIDHALKCGMEKVVAPVMMAGAMMNVPESVLPRFQGKRVRIYVHDDKDGPRAAQRWSEQLNEVADCVDWFTFDGLFQSDGQPVKDLNDLCRLDVDSWERHRHVVEQLMTFEQERMVA